MSLATWAMTALAGALGAMARYLTDGIVSAYVGSRFPFGTLVVNVGGSLLFGVTMGLSGDVMSSQTRLVLAVGFCGSFTTFSTQMAESAHLFTQGRSLRAVANLAGSLLAGLLAVGLGSLVAAMLAA